ncbi:MAG: hypothetical protein SP4CHLAM5_00990 [Chlamydiia bacterium]|nr:hypothetical protein [Chlamydiia bacterium]MCH9617975.1 hypothetical protein [Chlamydiia bacterium]MCH9623700.1 hypothetical protein [Chlamydiia bacterium]
MKILRNLFYTCLAVNLFASKGDIPIYHVEYFDIGRWESDHFIDTGTGTVSEDRIDSYLYYFFQDMWGQGQCNVNFCHGQAVDLSNFIKGDYASMSATNSFGILEKKTLGKLVGGKSVSMYVVDWLITSVAMKTGISFGGKAATGGDWDFGFDKIDPVELAQDFSTWANDLALSRLDFDVQSADFIKNDPQKLASFFTTLKDHFNGRVTLTVPGDVTLWGLQGKNLFPLFRHAPFKTMFDSLNLILFDQTHYYLNAGQKPVQNWDLFLWISQLAKDSGYTFAQAASLVNIGFNASINYLDKECSKGPIPYEKMPSGITNGNASKFIFDKLQDSLTNETITLGCPFYMDSNADYSVSSSNGYESQFFNNTGNFELDFQRYNYFFY